MSKKTEKAVKAATTTPALPETGFLHDVGELCRLVKGANETISTHVETRILPAFYALPGIEAGKALTDEARKTPEFRSLRDAFKRGAALYYQANIYAGEGEVSAVAAWETGKTSPAYKALSAEEREVYDRVADRVAGYVDEMFSRHVVAKFPKAETSAAKAGGRGRGKGEGKGKGEAVEATPETLAHAMTWAQVIETVERKAAGDDVTKAAQGLAALIKAAQAASKRVAARAKMAA